MKTKNIVLKVPSKWANFAAHDIGDPKKILAWGRTIQSLMRKLKDLGVEDRAVFFWVPKQGRRYIFAAA